jgi:hypothetical protein
VAAGSVADVAVGEATTDPPLSPSPPPVAATAIATTPITAMIATAMRRMGFMELPPGCAVIF